MKLFQTLTIAIFTSLVLTACSDSLSPSPYRPLSESGIQILSTDNPYHGPNMVMGRTLEASPSLAGYFHYRGAPRAIEVREANRSSEELLLYYPEDHTVYVARKHARRAPRDWMISGPYGIGKNDYRQINNWIDRKRNDPVFLVNGMMTRYHSPRPKMQRISFEPEIPLIAKPKPKPKPKPIVVVKKEPEPKTEEIKTTSGKKVRIRIPDLDDPRFVPRNSDQVALLEARGYAERADNGDILHPVSGNAQALQNIADWYMGSPKMLADLQEANELREDQLEVRKGTVVVIPQRFIKNTKKMPINHRITKAPDETPDKMVEDKKDDTSKKAMKGMAEEKMTVQPEGETEKKKMEEPSTEEPSQS